MGRLLPRSIWARGVMVLLVVLVPVLLLAGAFQFSRVEERRAIELNFNLELARAVARTFNSYVNDILHQEAAVGLALTSSQPFSVELANTLLDESDNEYPSVRFYGWATPQGRIIAAGDLEAIGLDVSDRKYFQSVLAGKSWAIGDLVIGKITGTPTFTLARGIRNSGGMLEGVMLAAVDPERLGEVLSVARSGGASIAIVDPQGLGVYRYPELSMSWDQRNWINNNPLIKTALAGQEVTGMVRLSPDREAEMQGISPIGAIGWAAIATRPESEVMGPVLGDLLRDLALLLSVAVAALLAAVAIARSIAGPLEGLRQHALAIGRGELGRRTDIRGPAEVAEVASAFNHMADEVQTREAMLQRYQLLSRHTRDIILFIRPDGTIMEANEAAVRAYGYTLEELISMDAARLGISTPPPISAIQVARTEASGHLLEAVHRRKNGTTFPVEVSSQSAIIGNEKVLLNIIRDISERKRAEEERDRLFARQVDARKKSDALNDINVTITSTLDFDEIMQRVVVQAGRVIGCESTVIGLREQESWMMKYAHGMSEAIAGKLLTDDDLPHAALAIGTGRPVSVDDVSDDERVNHQVLDAYGIRSVLVAPLVAKDEVFGAFFFCYQSAPVAFTEDDIDFASELATSVSLALANARLFEAERRQRGLAEDARQRISSILESITDAFIALDREFRFTYVNKEAERILQRSRGELMGMPMGEAFPDLVGSRFERECQRGMSEQESVAFEEFFPFLGIWLDVHVYPAPERLSVYFQDITERKRAEQQLVRTSSELQAIFRALPDLYFRIDPEGKILDYKAGLTADLYVPTKAFLGKRMRDVLPSEVVELLQRAVDRVHATNTLVTVEYPLRLREEDQIFEARLLPFLEGETIVFVRNITERKQAEENLKAAKDYSDRLINTANAMIIGLDLQANIVLFNRAAEKVTGYRRGEVLGKNWFELLVPRDRYPQVAVMFSTLVKGGLLPTSSENPIITKSGEERDISWRNSVMREKGRIAGTISFGIDITERKRAERFREEYLSLISHDLRGPLTVIQAQTQFLKRDIEAAGLAGRPGRSAEAIITASRRMNAMIQDLVDSARIEAGQLRLDCWPVDLRQFLQDFLERSAPAIGDGRVILEVGEGLPPVNADLDRLERIILNLLTNALKYSGSDRPVVITAHQVENRAIMVSVADQGEGIAPEDLPHVFERFYRARGARRTEGIGLGLYITRMLVEAHGGRIWAESEPGKGSTFYFTLPLA